MLDFRLCAVTAIGLFAVLDGYGVTEVEVGQEFAVDVSIKPEIRQLGPAGEVLQVTFPEAPYHFEFKYDRNLIVFTRADAGIETAYREITGTPWAVLAVTTSERSGYVYFQALKVTESDVKLPVANATAGGAALPVENLDLLRIVPKPAALVVDLQRVPADG